MPDGRARSRLQAFAVEHLQGVQHHRFTVDPPEIVEVPYYGKPGRPAKGAPSPKRSATA